MRQSFDIVKHLESLPPISAKSLGSVFKDPAFSFARKTRMMSFDPRWRDALIDKHNREHNYLRISITEKCNLRCVYCMPEDGVKLTSDEKLMKTHEIVSLANLFVRAGVDKIRLTGGEPTVHPEFDKILKGISSANGLRTLGITTNGLKISGMIPLLKECGVNVVNVSLDTLEEDKFELMTRRKGFHNVLDGILKLVEAGFCQVKVNCVVMRGVNDDEILNFVDLTRHLPIHVRFIEFMPFDENNWVEDKILPSASLLARIASEHPSLKPVGDISANETAKLWKIDAFKGGIGVISSMTDKFCSTCNRLRLTSDGKMKNCLFGTEEFDLLTAMRAEGPRGDWEDSVLEVIAKGVSAKAMAHGGVEGGVTELGKGAHLNRPMVRIGG